MSSHEPLDTHRAVVSGTNRNFGLTFAAVFLLLALWPWLWRHEAPRFWALAVSGVFAAFALFAENKLTRLNRLWLRLGFAMHAFMSPIIMGALFYFAVTPVAVVMRAIGKDLLHLRRHNGPTYWIERKPLGPPPGSMKNQF